MPLDPTQTVISSLSIYENRMFVGFADYKVVIIDLSSFEKLAEIKEGLWEVKSIYSDKSGIYVGSLNEKVIVYGVADNQVKNEVSHKLGVICVNGDTDYIYTGSFNGKINIWNKNDLQLNTILDGHLIRVNSIHVDSNLIYSGDGFTTLGAGIRIWEKNGFKQLSLLKDPPSKRVNCFTSNGKYLISGHGSPGEIRIWSKSSMTLKHTIKTMSDVKSLDINNNQLFCAMKDQIMIFNLENFTLLKEIKEYGREVNSVKLYSDYIIYSSRDKIKVINSKDFQLIAEINFKN